MDIFSGGMPSMELPSLDRRMLYGLMLAQLATANTAQWNPQQAVVMALQQRRLAEAQRQKMEEKLAPTYQKIGDSLVQIGPMYERQGDRVVRRQGLPEITPVYQEPQEATGPFAGTGMEAQALNIIMDPTIPDNDPRKIFARQRLEQIRTVSTPEGTYQIPGYDVNAAMGGGVPTQPQPGTQPGPGGSYTPNVSDAQRVRAGQVSQLEQTNETTPDYAPTMSEGFAEEVLPDFVARQWFYSDAYKNARPGQLSWSSTASKLINGGNASDDDIKRIQEAYWPVQGDSAEVIKQKRESRLELQKAIRAGLHPSQAGLPWWGGDDGSDQDGGDGAGGSRWVRGADGRLVREGG